MCYLQNSTMKMGLQAVEILYDVRALSQLFERFSKLHEEVDEDVLNDFSFRPFLPVVRLILLELESAQDLLTRLQ